MSSEFARQRAASGPLTAKLELSRCTFLLALPTSRESFNAVAAPGRFAGRWFDWERFSQALYGRAGGPEIDEEVGVFTPRLEPFRYLSLKSSFNFIGDATFADFRRTIASDQQVVALLAHCESKGPLEFMDGFVEPEIFAEAVPSDFTGVIHLSACHSVQRLMPLVKERASSCVVGWFNGAESAQEWLALHAAVFMLLATHQARNYYDAWLKIAIWRQRMEWR